LEGTITTLALPIMHKLLLEKQQLEGEVDFLNRNNDAFHSMKTILEEIITYLE
jgi:hypothetical protein